MDETRRRRANGEASRERILDAAAAIAGERGYEGTSINLISERSGAPASSIYWHFKDKDQLIAAVIDRSFAAWLHAISAPWSVPPGESREASYRLTMRRTGAAIAEFPDFLRLGLLLILEKRPNDPTARARFLEARSLAKDRTRAALAAVFPDLDEGRIEVLVTLTIAMSDGMFVAHDADGVHLEEAFDMLAIAILGAADRMRAERHGHSVMNRTG